MYTKAVLPIIGLILLCFNFGIAQENKWVSTRPDAHAPIGVMGDHYHKKNELMASYRYMPMSMNGTLKTTDDISEEIIHQNFMVAPQKMDMDMHMLGIMYAPSDYITLMLMGNYISKSMNLRCRMMGVFTTKSEGIGDISIASLIKIMNKNRQLLHGNIGVSIPMGSINQRYTTPMKENASLAYPMQLGSGTWDPSFGLTYLGQSDLFSWGAQSIYKFRIGENSKNYRFGNHFDLVAWGSIKVSDYLSFSTSLSYFDSQKINGLDKELNIMMMPLFNTANSGRTQIDVGFGTNFLIPEGFFKNLRLGVELKIPAYQKVNGVQMKNTLTTTFGIQYSIGHK